jgi:hypothetical protein
VIFGSSSQESYATDVNFLDGFFDGWRGSFGDTFTKCIEVTDDDADGMNGLSSQIG